VAPRRSWLGQSLQLIPHDETRMGARHEDSAAQEMDDGECIYIFFHLLYVHFRPVSKGPTTLVQIDLMHATGENKIRQQKEEIQCLE